MKVIEGDGKIAAELTNQKFDHVFFTGGENIGKKVVPGGGFVAGSQKGSVIEFDKMKELARAREVEGEERGLLWNIHINDMTPGSVQDWINLYKLYRYYQDKSPEEEDHPGALVHCLAGFGRTGTTLLLFSLLNKCDYYLKFKEKEGHGDRAYGCWTDNNIEDKDNIEVVLFNFLLRYLINKDGLVKAAADKAAADKADRVFQRQMRK